MHWFLLTQRMDQLVYPCIHARCHNCYQEWLFFEEKETAGIPKCCRSSFRNFWYMIWKQSKKPILHSLPIYWYKYQLRLSKPNHDGWFQMCNYSAIGASSPIIVYWLVVRVSKNQMPDSSDTSKDMWVHSSQCILSTGFLNSTCVWFFIIRIIVKRNTGWFFWLVPP